MKKVIIGFSKSTKCCRIGSWLIKLYMGTDYSHCYIKLPVYPIFPSNKIFHAAEGQVSHYSETAFLTRNKIVHEFELDVDEDIYNFLVDYIFHEKAGEPYSILQNIGLVISKLFKLDHNLFTKGWNCSEYAFVVLETIYPEVRYKVNRNLATPKDVYDILCDLNVKKIDII